MTDINPLFYQKPSQTNKPRPNPLPEDGDQTHPWED